MNKLKLKITSKLELVSIVPTTINKLYPTTQLEIKNWEDFKDYNLKVVLKNNNNSVSSSTKLVNGKCELGTNALLKCKGIGVIIYNGKKNVEVNLDFENISYEAKVFETEETKKYSSLLENLLERYEDLEKRVQELELENEKSIL